MLRAAPVTHLKCILSMSRSPFVTYNYIQNMILHVCTWSCWLYTKLESRALDGGWIGENGCEAE